MLPFCTRCLEDSAYKGDANCVLSILENLFPNAWQGFPFHSGGLGAEGVFARRCVHVHKRPQPSTFATVRNRPQPFATVRVIEGVMFGGFKRRVASFLVAGVGLRDIQTCFVTCRRSFCVVIFLRRFQKMGCSFRGRRNALDVSIVILRGRRSTLDVSCCVFFQNALAAACGMWRECADSVAGVAFCRFCEMWWKLTEASHETSILRLQNLEVPRKIQ